MIGHFLRLVWNRRRANALILVELLISFVGLSVILTLAVAMLHNYRQPLGFDYENVWRLDLVHEDFWMMAEEERAGMYEIARQLSITLPNDMADALRNRVSVGDYASESEVIREGLRALFARDRAVEAWLQTEVAAAYDAAVADPTRTVSAQAVRDRLVAEQAGSG